MRALPGTLTGYAFPGMPCCAMNLSFCRKQHCAGTPHMIRSFPAGCREGKPLTLQLTDPFLLFHDHVLRKAEANGFHTFSDSAADQGRYVNWRGHAFEMLCQAHVFKIWTMPGMAGVKTAFSPRVSETKSMVRRLILSSYAVTALPACSK